MLPSGRSRMSGAPLLQVWLLVDDRPGHRTQVTGLARKLGWPAIEHKLSFNWLNRLPNPILGSSVISLDRTSQRKLVPPYPDLVVGMGRRVLPIARRIRARSCGHTHIVILGRKAGGGAMHADLFVSCAHFGTLPKENLFELVVPPTQVDMESLAEARSARPDPMVDLARPRTVLLVGGPTAQHAFTPSFAARMAGEIATAAARLGGDLAIVTSRRTPSRVIDTMRIAAPEAHLHLWEASRKDNPYLSYIAHADYLAVTGESESMLAEGAAARLPLTIYPLEAVAPGPKRRFAVALRMWASGEGAGARLARFLLESGWIAPPRDLSVMHRAMEDQGLAKLFDGSINTSVPCPNDELDRLTQAIDKLIASPWRTRTGPARV
jgi:uncharacterized protein